MIVSRQNERIKKVRSLENKKFRDESGLFVVEGLKSVADAFTMGERFEKVFVTEKGKTLLGGLVPHIFERVEFEILSDDVFKSVSGEVSPQGILATVYKKVYKPTFPCGSCLFLDEVADPSNVGAIIRTAAASGFCELYLAGNTADAFSPKSVRASMGGIFRVKVYVGEREELLKYINVPIVVADMNGENVFSAKFPQRVCLVIGNEARGVSATLRERAEVTLAIPMQNGMESLNASVSAGILMYALKK